MKILTLVVGPIQTNCYFLIDEDTCDTVIIDPGAEARRLIGEIEKNGLKPRLIINTHGHADHIEGNAALKQKYSIPVCIHSDDAGFLTDPALNLSAFAGGKQESGPPADIILEDGGKAGSGSMELKVMHTPGHTPGSICLIHKDGFMFTGDTLFAGDIGRTDLPGGSSPVMEESLKKFRQLPPETKIFPGHGPCSTVGYELRNNPCLPS